MAACGIDTCVRGMARLAVLAMLLCRVITTTAMAADPDPAAAPPPAAVPQVAVTPTASAARPLHEVIDALVTAAAVGPCAPRCSDADFVRRIHLDLTGVIPTTARVRAFLADPAGDKRTKLVDDLLADPGFARHVMFVLDAMLLERASPSGDLAAAWREYLFSSLVDDKPLDGMFRDLLVSDGSDPAMRPAAAFLLTRDAEPVQLTRAIGRLYFGRDLQCAQCHDHPIDDDIRQAEHQGLYAFVARTSLFRGKDNALLASEKADGEVDYQSVFTKEGEKGVWPRLPGGMTLVDEPRPEPDAAYVTEPTKTSHGVPAFSRRAALAARLADDHGFRLNLANRIWAIFFGRGLVHPLDGIGPDNAATHPGLLLRLAEALREQGFRLRPLVREIVLSETYQRSVEPPGHDEVSAVEIGARVTSLEGERIARTAALETLEQAAAAAETRRQEAVAATRAVHVDRLARLTERDAASKAAAAATAAAATTSADLTRARTVSDALVGAVAQATRAVELTAGDAALQSLAATLAERASAKGRQAEAVAQAHAEKQAAADTAMGALTAARGAAEDATARLGADDLARVEREAVAARRAATVAAQEVRRLDARIQLARDLLAHADLVGTDPAAAAVAWQSIVDRWTDAGQVAALRALSPEQLALSVQQATGALAARQANAAAAIDKAPPEALAKASADERDDIRAMQVEMRMVKDASGLLRSAATLFGDTLSDGFQASVSQALYFGNAPDIQGQLAPSGSNLVATLAAMSEAAAVADEAYVAVLSRPPADDERADVAAFLDARPHDRTQAIAELVWALVSSNEFRFNH